MTMIIFMMMMTMIMIVFADALQIEFLAAVENAILVQRKSWQSHQSIAKDISPIP